MPITHPALPSEPELWRYTLADGHTAVALKVDDIGAPVFCHNPEHGPDAGPGVLVSIVRIERAG